MVNPLVFVPLTVTVTVSKMEDPSLPVIFTAPFDEPGDRVATLESALMLSVAGNAKLEPCVWPFISSQLLVLDVLKE
jgi:hypothetical protein